MAKSDPKHTPFTKALMASETITNNVKTHLVKYINTVQASDITDLFNMLQDINTELADKIVQNDKDPKVQLNGILLIIIQDEINLRNSPSEEQTPV